MVNLDARIRLRESRNERERNYWVQYIRNNLSDSSATLVRNLLSEGKISQQARAEACRQAKAAIDEYALLPESTYREITETIDAEIAAWESRVQPTPGSSALNFSPASTPDEVPSGNRAKVDAFISKVKRETGHCIKRKDIWRVAGYKDSTEFERFQREDPKTTFTAKRNFDKVLQKTSTDFLKLATPPSGLPLRRTSHLLPSARSDIGAPIRIPIDDRDPTGKK
ncbi:MAG: hypothetical protein IT166_18895 [Bryobacterales bacterium]|nr:hypothetical protein [Bryobacterales bacterium]